MKRHALLIGYTASDSCETTIAGVLKDLEDYKNYLMQPKGGAWYEDEITILNGPSKTDLKHKILILKANGIDISFTVFSGHGSYNIKEQSRVLLINKNETILSRELLGIAKREILICDSCSGICNESITQKSMVLLEKNSYDIRIQARKKYEALCLKCNPQTIRLYAAKIGTSAEDDNGGIYTQALLETLNNSKRTMSIVNAHDDACSLVKLRTLKGDDSYQEPSRQVPKLLEFLPGSIII
jgi:hypothetical protein